MKCEVGRRALNEALAKLSKVVPRHTTLPVLQNVLLEVEPGELRLTGTDLDITCALSIPAQNTDPGGRLVPAVDMRNFLRGTAKGSVTIESKDKDTVITTDDGTVMSFDGMYPNEYPTWIPPIEGFYEIPGDRLVEMLESTAFSASDETCRPILNGVYWHAADGKSRAVATNGHILALRECAGFKHPGFEVILPAKAAALLQRLHTVGATMEATMNTVELPGLWVTFRGKEYTVVSRAIEGPYPDYRRVIPTPKITAVVSVRELLASLAKLARLADKHTKRVAFHFLPKTLRCEVDGDGAEVLEIPAVLSGANKFDIAFNVEYLSRILKHLGTETAEIGMTSPESAARIRSAPENEEGKLYLVMPLRTL